MDALPQQLGLEFQALPHPSHQTPEVLRWQQREACGSAAGRIGSGPRVQQGDHSAAANGARCQTGRCQPRA